MTITISFPDLSAAGARIFYDAIGGVANLYLYLGRSAAWTAEPTPNTPLSNVATDVDARNHMEYFIQVTAAECSLVIPNITWTSGTVYTPYSSTATNLFSTNFYVITSTNSVYKCISNNNGVASTAVPIGETTSVVTTSDGYHWKFMFNLSVPMAETFLSSAWIPVPTGDQKTTYQQQVEQYAEYSTGSPPMGHGASAAQELGASDIIISVPVFLDSLVAGDFKHRQFGLILNPTLISDGSPCADASYVVDSNVLINVNSGDLLTCSNHAVVDNATDSTEVIQIIVSF